MTQDPNIDPLDVAMSDAPPPPPPTRTVFGEVQVDTFFCVLLKGEGKVPFDPGVHQSDARRVAIELTIIPLRGNYTIKRDIIAESNDWAKIIKPSIRALNTDLRAINNCYVQVEMVAAGKYTDRQTGEERQRTMPKFVAVYPGLEECIAAAKSHFSSNVSPVPATPLPATPAGDGVNPKERETALRFLPALWNQSKGDVAAFQQLIAGNPLTSKYFNLSSPEVVALVASSDLRID